MTKMMFLVPFDFSPCAGNAGKYASALAQATDSCIIFLHVISPFVDEDTYLTTATSDVIVEVQAELDLYVQSIVDDYKINARGIVAIGDPTKEILKNAGEKKVKLIIMGSHDVSPVMKFFFGTTTTSVIEKSTTSVLVVPENVGFSKPDNIVYATDYENSDIDALQELAKLAAVFNAEINVVHITDHYDGTELSIIEYFSDLVKKHIGYPKIVCRIYKNENILKGIEIFADTVGANMIALSMRKHKLLGDLLNTSLTKEFVYRNTTPIIAFHQHKFELSNEF